MINYFKAEADNWHITERLLDQKKSVTFNKKTSILLYSVSVNESL